MASTPPLTTRPPTTEYGTTSIGRQEGLNVIRTRRCCLAQWVVVGLGVAAGLLALVDYGGGVGHDSVEIECWQSSNEDGKAHMMAPVSGLKWTPKTATDSFITVDTSVPFQEIYGFGGAFTESSALMFQQLPRHKQEEVLALFFDREQGSGYTLGRVPMGSTDFALSPYNHDNVTGDKTLTHFDTTVARDAQSIIPFIQRALATNPAVKLILSPWSPPGWMKRADPAAHYVPSMIGSARPNGLRDDMREAWAHYFAKFITAYKTHGVAFWGLTPQNEPGSTEPWDACAYDASFEAEFVGDFLGPLLAREHPDVKIMVYDHIRTDVLDWVQTMAQHPTASKYVDGVAVHWDSDGERVLDGILSHDQVNDTHYVNESWFILATESSSCPGIANGTDAWFRAQRYAHDILTNLNNWVVGWIDWNLILDHRGGPNHWGNYCDAPIVIDETGQDYFIQPMYYFIQHFSKFVPPGSHRVATAVAVKYENPGEPQLFPRFPVALHSCDGSSRQIIEWTEGNKLQVKNTALCIDLVDPSSKRPQVQLVECEDTSQQWVFEDEQLRMAGKCLQLKHGSTVDGVALVAGGCGGGDHQRWVFHSEVMQSRASTGKCVTAGYSFLQSVAFTTPGNKTIAVVLNENTEDVSFALQNGDQEVEITIPAGAIRTFSWAS